MDQTLILTLSSLSYLVGAIPTGYWIALHFFRVDITKHGSGNIGATNFARVLQGGVKYFFMVFIIDAAKAFLMLLSADILLQQQACFSFHLIQNYLLIFACALLFGNAHSVFLKFKGGKGVATALGIVAYLIPLPLLFLFVATWVAIMATTRQAFMASLGATFMLIVSYGLQYYSPQNILFYFLCAIFVWLLWRHRSNIHRFLNY